MCIYIYICMCIYRYRERGTSLSLSLSLALSLSLYPSLFPHSVQTWNWSHLSCWSVPSFQVWAKTLERQGEEHSIRIQPTEGKPPPRDQLYSDNTRGIFETVQWNRRPPQRSSIEPSRRFDRTPKKVRSNPKRFYRNLFWAPKRFPCERTSEPSTGFYRTFRIAL